MDFFRAVVGLFDLRFDEVFDSLGLAGRAGINELLLLHVNHVLSVGREMMAEMILKHEKLLLKEVLRSNSLLSLYRLLPHSHELPLLELLEEVELLNVIVRVPLNQPLAE